MMKAIVFDNYGGPENLYLSEVPEPTPGDDEVLIEVKASSVNPYDWHHLRGMLPIRFFMGVTKPHKNTILGADVAGVIVAVGKEVTDFEVGQEIYGNAKYGAFAAYVCVKPENIAIKPPNLSFEEAASIPMVGYTALQGISCFGRPKADQHILINGASGGIGTIAVQLAKHFGTKVTGVSSSAKVELVRSMGADHVVDYEKQPVQGQFDLVMDNVGNLSIKKIRSLLKPEGNAVITGYTNYKLLLSAMVFGGKRIKMFTANSTREDLEFLGWLLREEKIRPVIDTVYPLHEASKAMKKIATRHVRGKVVLTME